MKFFLVFTASLLLFSVLFSILFFGAANAGTMCYSPREAEAEQGIRIHSKLMVIGLNCTHIAATNGGSLYAEHRKFTAKHASLFATYETILMDYMKKSGDNNPEFICMTNT